MNIVEFIRNHRIEFTIFGVTFGLALLAYFANDLRFANDDQFILYRYIENIARGTGFVFNPGERVLGATTPLFTVIAAWLAWLLPSVPTQDLVAILNAVFLAASAPLIFLITRRFSSVRIALLAAAIFALNLARTIPEGMETPLFILTLLSFLEAFFGKRYGWSAVFLALTVLTRPDALLIAMLAFIAWWGRLGLWRAIRLSAGAALVALPWLLFAVSYFGSALPQSLAAKLQSADIYHLPQLQAVKVQFAHLSRIFWGRLFDPANLALQFLVNLMPFLVLAMAGARKLLRSDAWLIVLIPITYLVSFGVANPVMFPWYLSETEPLWIILAALGVARLFDHVHRASVRGAVMAFLLAGPIFAYAGLFMHGEGGKTPYRDAAAYISEHRAKDDIIGLSDIGIVAYETGMPIVDFIGLTSPDSVGFYPIPDSCVTGALYVVPPLLIRAYEPEWIVASEEQLGPCLREDAWFTERYVQEALYGAIGVFHRAR